MHEYKLSNRLRLTAIIFMVVGGLLFAVDYFNLPKDVEAVKELEAGHGDGHGAEVEHGETAHFTATLQDHGGAQKEHQKEAGHGESAEGHHMSEEEH